MSPSERLDDVVLDGQCVPERTIPYGEGGGGVLYAAHVSGKVSEAWVTPGGLQGTQGYSSFCDQLL